MEVGVVVAVVVVVVVGTRNWRRRRRRRRRSSDGVRVRLAILAGPGRALESSDCHFGRSSSSSSSNGDLLFELVLKS